MGKEFEKEEIHVYVKIYIHIRNLKINRIQLIQGLPGDSDGKEPACQCRRPGFHSLAWEDSPGEGHGNPLQYPCLENPMDRGAWWATVHGITQSRHDSATNTFTFIYFQVISWMHEIKGALIFQKSIHKIKIYLPGGESRAQKFLKTSSSFCDTGGAEVQSFSG